MKAEGPLLETLTRRLAETPEDFLAEPRIGASGSIHVAAVAADLAKALGVSVKTTDVAALEGVDPRRDRNRLSITLLLCWLLADEWFAQNKMPAEAVLELLAKGSVQLGEQVASRKFVTDPDRREELARF